MAAAVPKRLMLTICVAWAARSRTNTSGAPLASGVVTVSVAVVAKATKRPSPEILAL